MTDKEERALRAIPISETSDSKGLDDYVRFLNNKYKTRQIKRIIRDFSARH